MDLIDYMASLPATKITPLYDSFFTCLAVFRSLEPIAKQYLFRLIFAEDGMPQSVVSSWALPSAASKHSAAIGALMRLQVLSTPTTIMGKSGEPAYHLLKSFTHHIRTALCSGTQIHLHEVPDEVVAVAPLKESLDEYAASQWEMLLLCAVGGGPSPSPSAELQPSFPLNLEELLLSAGLIALPDATAASSSSSLQRHTVTQAGFQFLLADTYSQLWQLLREYIARAERQSSAELSTVLGFLLQLGFQGNRPLRCSELGPEERNIAAHMVQLGVLAAFRANREIWLQPTWLAVLMASGSTSTTPTSSDGFAVVETNSRVYAYTASPVRQAILRLFVRCDVLLPNLFVGTITRESAISALESGVSAEQIIGYLRQHAHSRVASRVPIVPGVVSDQIRLWQQELLRVKDSSGVFYKNFEAVELYRQVVAYGEELGVVLVKDDARREFVAVAEAHTKLREKIKEIKTKLGI